MELLKKVSRNLPQPFVDETFTSWVYRCENSKRSGCPRIGNRAMQSNYCCRTNRDFYEDPDFDFDSAYITSVLNDLSIDKAWASKFFRSKSNSLLPWGERKYFCPQCLQNDVARGYLPYWRKEWCCMLVATCSYHRVRLVAFHRLPDIGKAWHAFVYLTRSRGSEILPPLSSRWFDKIPDRFRCLLAEKSRRWFFKDFSGEADDFIVEEGKRKCFKIFFYLFLQHRTRRTALGLAGDIFAQRGSIDWNHRGYPFAFEFGAVESNSHQRMAALIWCGLLFSIYSDVEVCFLRKLHKDCYEAFDLTWAQIAKNYYGGMSISDYYYLRCKFSGIAVKSLEPAREFLMEFETRYRINVYFTTYGWDSLNCWQRWHLDPLDDRGC